MLILDMLAELKEALLESDLTIKVDLIDLIAVDQSFRHIIKSEMTSLLTEPP